MATGHEIVMRSCGILWNTMLEYVNTKPDDLSDELSAVYDETQKRIATIPQVKWENLSQAHQITFAQWCVFQGPFASIVQAMDQLMDHEVRNNN